jgi:hypothetical protein
MSQRKRLKTTQMYIAWVPEQENMARTLMTQPPESTRIRGDSSGERS